MIELLIFEKYIPAIIIEVPIDNNLVFGSLGMGHGEILLCVKLNQNFWLIKIGIS